MFQKLTVMICLVLLIWEGSSLAQSRSFATGKIGITINEYGRIRVSAPDLGTRQIDRSSLLVGTAAATVFDYKEDAEPVDSAIVVASPQSSDYELYVSIDNSYSNEPPAIMAKINVYGWTDQAFAIARIMVINQEATAVDATIGMEFIAQLEASYGFESVEFLPANQIVDVYRKPSSTHVSYKFLSANLASLKTFEWYDGYNTDEDFYTWLTYGAYDTLYDSGSDGAVAVFSQPPVNLASGASTTLYLGIAVGADQSTVVSNVDSAVVYYNKLIMTGMPAEPQPIIAAYRLDQNYPNPFNPQTSIGFYLPNNDKVRIKVYDLLGREVSTLVDQAMAAGEHSVTFDAAGMTSGVYFYSLQTGSFSQTRKMILIR